jgi:hypothetical protein
VQIVVQYMRLTALGAVPQLLHRRFEIELAWQVVSDNDGGAHAGVALRQVCEGIGTLPCRLPRGGLWPCKASVVLHHKGFTQLQQLAVKALCPRLGGGFTALKVVGRHQHRHRCNSGGKQTPKSPPKWAFY